MTGVMWVDPQSAGALHRYAQRRHAGALSEQQANALFCRGQGQKHQAIARNIGVKDAKVVDNYLRTAVQKLTDLETFENESGEGKDDDLHPGVVIDEVARRSGLASGLVRWIDLHARPRRRRPPAR
jgi:hypothetical protein